MIDSMSALEKSNIGLRLRFCLVGRKFASTRTHLDLELPRCLFVKWISEEEI